ncbi:MAG: nitroreductase family protein [Deltaproteobacteria bacterium]|nr:nitroreductase family protein [Deltaproteobacteria bacterium]
MPLGRIIVSKHDKGKDVVLYDAPLALIFYHSQYTDEADTFIACSYASIAAEALGLGTCMIGCVAPVIQRDKKLLLKYDIPPGHRPAIVMIIGSPKYRFTRFLQRSFLK